MFIDWNMNFTIVANVVDTDVTVRISVPMRDAAIVDFLGIFGSGDLETEATMRKEG